jgi:hypothetical protein
LKQNVIDISTRMVKPITFSILSSNNKIEDKNNADKKNKQVSNKSIIGIKSNLAEDSQKSVTTYTIKENFHKKSKTILFVYFDVIKNIINYFDKVEKHQLLHNSKEENILISKIKSFIRSVLKITIILLVLLINYLMIINEIFYLFYMYIIMMNDTRRCLEGEDIDHVKTCAKRWFCFIFLLFIDNIINIIGIPYLSIGMNLWRCFMTIYILLITGPPTGLQFITLNLFRIFKGLNLILNE